MRHAETLHFATISNGFEGQLRRQLPHTQDQVAHAKPNLRSNVPGLRHVGPSWAQVGPKLEPTGPSSAQITPKLRPSGLFGTAVGSSRPAAFLSVRFAWVRAVLVAKRLKYSTNLAAKTL